MPLRPHSFIRRSDGNRVRELESPSTFNIPYPQSPSPLIPPQMADPFVRGSDYLNAVRQLALDPGMIQVGEEIANRIRICTWIGQHIDAINLELNACLDTCHQCFQADLRREMHIWAAPLASDLGVDGLCNILLDPVVILIDVGRIDPADWLSIVVHEYVHAYLKSPGHDRHFLAVLTHLCLGLGLEPPVVEGMDRVRMEAVLRNWPHCGSRKDPLTFWIGND